MDIKLNLGCGSKIKPGFINVDFAGNYSGKSPDVEADIRKLPFPDDYADEAMAIHVLEHFYLWEAPDVLKEWTRVLKPGGKLIIEVPCLDKVQEFLINNPSNMSFTMFALYGDPRYRDQHMVHKWCYSKSMLRLYMEDVLTDVQESPAQYHFPERDMRMTGKKPCPSTTTPA